MQFLSGGKFKDIKNQPNLGITGFRSCVESVITYDQRTLDLLLNGRDEALVYLKINNVVIECRNHLYGLKPSPHIEYMIQLVKIA